MVLSACVVAMAFRTRDCFVDDAFIGFQYLRNLLSGEGFVFHVGDVPVEGVTNIGWLLTLAPFCTIAEPTEVAKLAGLSFVLLTLTLTISLGRHLAEKVAHTEDQFALVFPPMLMLVTNFDFIYFSLAGMETGLLAAILMLMACIALHRPRSLWLPLLGAFAFLVHPEAVAVYPVYAALGFWRVKDTDAVARRKHVVHVSILVGIVLVITCGRFAYFGDVVPNTFHSKPSDWPSVLQNGYAFLMGQNTNVAFPITGWLALPVLLLGYRRLWHHAPASADMLAAICGIGLTFAVYSRPDWTILPRYFAPYLPASLLLLWAGLTEAIRLLWRDGVRQRTKHAIAAVAMLLLVLTNVSDCRQKMAQMDDFPGYVLASKDLIRPAKWLSENQPEGATIATRRIGVLAYFTHDRVFDYAYGLPDAAVARLVARHGERFDMPTDPALAELWKSASPDFLLEDGMVMDMIIAQAKGTREKFFIHGIEYRVIAKFPLGRNTEWVLAKKSAE